MTYDTDPAPAGADAAARADASAPAWVCAAGRLTARLSPGLAGRIADTLGVGLRSRASGHEHRFALEFDLSACADAPDAPAPAVSLETVPAEAQPMADTAGRAERDTALRATLETEGVWGAQRALPRIDRLRRVSLLESDGRRPHPTGDLLDGWQSRGMLALLRYPVALHAPDALAALHEALDRIDGQFEWGTLDALVVELGEGETPAALSEPGLLRRLCALPVPILVRRTEAAGLIAEFAHRAADTDDEMRRGLEGILRRELRQSEHARLNAIARELTDPREAGSQGPLFA